MTIEEDKVLPTANIPKIVNDDGSLNLAQTSNHESSNGKLMMTADEVLQQITTMDLNNMSTEELKQYSDSLSQSEKADNSLDKAADIITDES